MPFLLNEDASLKAKLQGLVVHDSGSPSGRPVTVRFRNPEYELADVTYPLILLSHVRIARDPERESRGYIGLRYAPEGMARWSDMTNPALSPYMSQVPIPVDIDYQVEVYARKQVHLIELTDQLIQFGLLSERFGFLTVPQDGTIRRLDILGGPEYTESKDELGKRLFIAAWSIRVSSEIFLSPIDTPTSAQTVKVAMVGLPEYEDGVLLVLDELTVTAAPLIITTTFLPPAVVGSPYRAELTATGGTGTYLWSVARDSATPAGLDIAPNGFLFGTPSASTASLFGVTVTDTGSAPNQTSTAYLSIVVT